MVDAIVMAAGMCVDPELAQAAGGGAKSLIPVNKRPVVSVVVENLKNCEHVSRVILVADAETYDAAGDVDLFVEAQDYGVESVLRAVREADNARRCLMMGGDMPLASVEALTDLLTHAPESDVVYPIVERGELEQTYPDKQAFYIFAKEGRYTGSSCLLFRPSVALSNDQVISRLLRAREDPKSLIGLIGLGNAMKFMFSTLSLREFQQVLSDALGIDCSVFVSHYAELFVSIESIQDVDMIERELSC